MPRKVTTVPYDPIQYVPSKVSNIPALMSSYGWTEPQINNHQDKVAYVLNRILSAPLLNQKYQHGDYIRINKRVLAEMIGARYVDPILNLLLEAEVIECDYAANRFQHKSNGYRITQKAESKAVGLLVFKMEVFGKKLIARKEAREAEIKPQRLKNRMFRDLKKFGIHFEAAMSRNEAIFDVTQEFIWRHRDLLEVTKLSRKAYSSLLDEATATDGYIDLLSRKDLRKALLKKQKKTPETTLFAVLMTHTIGAYSCNKMAIEKIHRGAIAVPKRPLKGSRFYTFLTNLATWVRDYLYHKDYPTETLTNIDIKNSQPFMLNILLAKRFEGLEMPEDVRKYLGLTSIGTFYEEVSTAMKAPLETKRERREFKVDFFSNNFFCSNFHTANSKGGKYFQQAYPSVSQLIYDYKVDRYDTEKGKWVPNHNALALAMQKAEASVMIDAVMTTLQARKIWAATIHDSVVVRPGNVETVKAIIWETFQSKYQLTPGLNEEKLQITHN